MLQPQPEFPGTVANPQTGTDQNMHMAHPALNLAAITLYLAVAASSGVAAREGSIRFRPRREITGWMVVAGVFALLAVSRFLGVEALIDEALRGWFRNAGTYARRQEIQGPIAATALAGLAVVFGLRSVRYSRQRRTPLERAVFVSAMGVLTMVGLVVIRLVSLHLLDSLLFGPARLNWLIDIGASVLTGAGALRYISLASLPDRLQRRHTGT